MNNYNPTIHHRHSTRLKGYDYSQAGLYFITICVNNRKCLFGEIVGVDDIGVQNFEPPQSPNESVSSVWVENFQPIHQPRYQMILNDAGKIADQCWLEIPKHFPDTVLHEHIIMPNHVHGIIELIKIVSPNAGAENFLPLHSQNDSESSIGVQNFEPQQSPNKPLSSIWGEYFQPQRNEYQKIIPRSIGSIVRGYKIGVTKWFRNNIVAANGVGVQNFEPLQIWQRNYYEHIIRDEKSYYRISEYIINNPKNWKDDDLFKYR